TSETPRSEVLQCLGRNGSEASDTTPLVPPPVPYTPDARASLQLALQEARGLRAASLGPELLLLGVLRVLLTTPAGSAGATLATLLNAAGLTPDRVRGVIARGDQAQISAAAGTRPAPARTAPYPPRPAHALRPAPPHPHAA